MAPEVLNAFPIFQDYSYTLAHCQLLIIYYGLFIHWESFLMKTLECPIMLQTQI